MDKTKNGRTKKLFHTTKSFFSVRFLVLSKIVCDRRTNHQHHLHDAETQQHALEVGIPVQSVSKDDLEGISLMETVYLLVLVDVLQRE